MPNTTSQYKLPEMGQQSASKAHRAGGAERFADPVVHKSRAGDLALSDSNDRLRMDLARPSGKSAKPHDGPTFDRLRSIPGVGKSVALVLLSAMHAIHRCPRVQDGVSSCRLGKCAKASAGKRSGPSGTKRGNASLTWAFAAAALCLRHHPEAPKSCVRLEQKPGQDTAFPIVAHTLARAVYDMLTRARGCAMPTCLHG